MKKTLSIILMSLCSVAASAQSKNFELGKALDIQNIILKQLAVSYVDTVQFDKLLQTGIDAMLESLDPYTVYFPEEDEDNVEMMTTGNYGGVGSLIKKKPGCGVVITEPYPGSPAVKAGLMPGDTIICIDGKDVYDETSQESSDRMKGQPGTDVRFKVIKGRTKETVEVVVHREKIHLNNVENAMMIQDSVGYILLSGFTQGASQEVKEAVKKLKEQGAARLVLDLRGNGGGLMSEAVEIVSLFVPEGTLVVSSKGRAPGMNVDYHTKKEPLDTQIPLMVVINSASASASEIVAGALQDLDRATIAGTRSFGKGLIQSVRPTSYNGAVKITTGKYYTPSGRCVQAIDYSHRNEDGSVGTIPDSLTHEFKTAGGRTVRDGGGITPDIVVEGHKYSRPTVSLVLNDIIGDFAVGYFMSHAQIAPAAEFSLTDAEYDSFIAFCETLDFDFRSSADAEMEKLIDAARYDGLYENCKAELDALQAKLDITKADALRLAKDEIKPLLEAEIVVKYYYQQASSIISLRSDSQLHESLSKWQ